MSDDFMLIRVDASPKIGAGHLMRTLALALEWERRGNHTIFMSKTNSLLNVHGGIKVIDDVGTIKEAVSTALTALEIEAKYVVVDGYQFDATYQEIVGSFDIPLLYIDDIGHCDYYSADLVLNQNLHANESLYLDSADRTKYLFGPEYLLLRPQFICQRRELSAKFTPGIASTILVAVGSGGTGNLAESIVEGLLSLYIPDLRILVVSNYDHPQLDIPKVELLTNVDNMAKVMSCVDFAISGGGLTTWELAHMGVPAIAIAKGKHEEMLISAAAEYGSVIDGGTAEEFNIDKFARLARGIIFDPLLRCNLIRQGQTITDGRGAERVIDEIMESYVEK